MADKEASLILKLKDKASQGIRNLSTRVKEFTSSSLGATIQFGSLVAVVTKSLSAFFEQENAVNRLNQALKNQGVFSEQLSKEMQNYAAQLQKTSTFGDETILSTQALLTSFGLAGEEMKKATQSTLDFASGLGIDLNTAALLVGKAFAGDTGTLSRYGITIDQNIPKNKQFAAVLDQINQKFGGQAQAEIETYRGRLKQLGSMIGDLSEEIGEGLAPIIDKAVAGLGSVITKINELGGLGNTISLFFVSLGLAIVDFVQVAIDTIPGMSTLFKTLGLDIGEVNRQLQEQAIKMTDIALKQAETAQEQILNSKLKTKSVIDAEKRQTKELEKEAAKQEKLGKEKNEKRMAEDVKAIQARREANAAANAAQFKNFESTMNQISSLSQSKNKQLAAIGKAAAITSATIDTYRAANVALASAPPPFNFVLAALVTAAGLSNVGRIAGIPLAEGGIVMPRSGGISATIGEAGKAEAVIPLDDERTAERLAESGFGGGSTIVINAGVVVGGREGMHELATMIDKELFVMRRNNESVAFDSI